VALRHVARPAQGTEPIVRVGDVEVKLERRRVEVNGRAQAHSLHVYVARLLKASWTSLTLNLGACPRVDSASHP
jgi:hypothetical protein